MTGVVHNAEYFRWFEIGRLGILGEIMSLDEAAKLGVNLPVISNHCEYREPARYGDRLLLTTVHERVQPYPGNLRFQHTLTNEKTKREVARGETVVTIVNLSTGQLVREWPAEVWERYLALA
jgi:acyl-CoA thioester hydrolase